MTATSLTTNVITKSIRYQIAGSKPGTLWTVTRDPVDGALSCDCPDATYRNRQCKHQRAVIAGTAGKPIVRCSVRPTRHFTDALDFVDLAHAEADEDAVIEGPAVMEGLNLPDEGMPRPTRPVSSIETLAAVAALDI